jgi:hypothetical protein
MSLEQTDTRLKSFHFELELIGPLRLCRQTSDSNAYIRRKGIFSHCQSRSTCHWSILHQWNKLTIHPDNPDASRPTCFLRKIFSFSRENSCGCLQRILVIFTYTNNSFPYHRAYFFIRHFRKHRFSSPDVHLFFFTSSINIAKQTIARISISQDIRNKTSASSSEVRLSSPQSQTKKIMHDRNGVCLHDRFLIRRAPSQVDPRFICPPWRHTPIPVELFDLMTFVFFSSMQEGSTSLFFFSAVHHR